MSINRWIAGQVAKRGIKQKFLSEQTGIPADRISKIMRDECRLRADEFLKICEVLEIDPGDYRAA